jgi:hypothetical protein
MSERRVKAQTYREIIGRERNAKSETVAHTKEKGRKSEVLKVIK